MAKAAGHQVGVSPMARVRSVAKVPHEAMDVGVLYLWFLDQVCQLPNTSQQDIEG